MSGTEELNCWVEEILDRPNNLATPIELREQAVIAVKAFQGSDADGNGTLALSEILILCESLGLPVESDEEEILLKMDSDDSGSLDLEEWVKWWLKRVSTLPNPAKQQQAIAMNTFAKYDTDNSGYIDCDEFAQVLLALGAKFSPAEIRQALAELDKDGNSRIECDEFVDWWCNRAVNNRQGGLMAYKLKKLAKKAAQIFNTDIFTATWMGDVDLVGAFLDGDNRIGCGTDTSEHGNGYTPLMYAAYQGHMNIVTLLLTKSVTTAAAINKQNDFGYTALFYAAQQGRIDICKLLLSKGADPSIFGWGDKDQPEDINLCPVDFCKDYRLLENIFRDHPRCATPAAAVSVTKMIASLSYPAALLTIELPSQRSVSQLPLHSWRIRLAVVTGTDGDEQVEADSKCGSDNDASAGAGHVWSTVVRARAVAELSQDVSVPVDKKWLRVWLLSVKEALTPAAATTSTSLTTSAAEEPLSSPACSRPCPSLCVRVSASNAMQEGAWSQSCPVDTQVFVASYMKAAMNKSPPPAAPPTTASTEAADDCKSSSASDAKGADVPGVRDNTPSPASSTPLAEAK